MVKDSSTASFNIEVPYEIVETGKQQHKPLIVYLHGYNQNITLFKEIVQDLLQINAYHLFIQAPYPIYDRKKSKRVEDWGRAWYLYDGRQEQFVRSLEKVSCFIEQVISEVKQDISPTQLSLLGYSMGGYLAGYFGLSRSSVVDQLIVVGGRIKTEVFKNSDHSYDNLDVLALHGSADKSVKDQPQKECCDQLAEWGADVTFKTLNKGHKLSKAYLREIEDWMS